MVQATEIHVERTTRTTVSALPEAMMIKCNDVCMYAPQIPLC